MSDFGDVRRIALGLPETTEDDLHFVVAGKKFAWPWRERVEPKKPKVRNMDVLAIRVSGPEEKQSLLDSDATKFFTERHYDGYNAVLVRLGEVGKKELTELLTDAWRVQAPRKLARDLS